jgi:catalase
LGNYGSTLGYEPNNYGEWQQQPEFAQPILALEGAAGHWDFCEDDNDYCTQPGLLFRLMGSEKQGSSSQTQPAPLAARRGRFVISAIV